MSTRDDRYRELFAIAQNALDPEYPDIYGFQRAARVINAAGGKTDLAAHFALACTQVHPDTYPIEHDSIDFYLHHLRRAGAQFDFDSAAELGNRLIAA